MIDWWIAAAIWIALTPAAVLAQSRSVIVAGVADAATGAPLTDALIEVPDVHRVARADWLGEVRIGDIPAGERLVKARMMGYQPASVTLLVRGDSVGVVFRLIRATPSLDTVHIHGVAVPAYMEQFERRRQVGLGRFLVAAQLDSIPSESVADFIARRFPGLHADWNQSRTEVDLRSTHTTTSLQYVCAPHIYVDGLFVRGDILAGLASGDIAGVEYYSIAPPVQYARLGAVCGVILFWTKRY